MQCVVSPYHLTTREPPALAALLLASRVVTLLPGPLEGAGDAKSAIAASARVPVFREFMKSWAWLEPLWKSGVIVAHVNGDSPVGDMYDVGRRIATDHSLSPLRGFTHERLYDDERSYLGALAGDLLRGGPDPGISVPLAAGLDRFAARHNMTVARSAAFSVAQRAEARMGGHATTIIAPILVQACAVRIQHARAVLADALEELWAAPPSARSAAWARYADTFGRRREEVLEGCREDEVRAIEGAAAITLMTLPGNAVLRSSLEAMAAVGPSRDRHLATEDRLPALYDALDNTTVDVMIVRMLGARRA